MIKLFLIVITLLSEDEENVNLISLPLNEVVSALKASLLRNNENFITFSKKISKYPI